MSKHQQLLSTLCCALSVLQAGCSLDMSSGYSFDFQGERSSRAKQENIPASVKLVDLSNVFGNISIRASENDDATVAWDLACWANTEQEAVRWTEQIQLLCNTEGDDRPLCGRHAQRSNGRASWCQIEHYRLVARVDEN